MRRFGSIPLDHRNIASKHNVTHEVVLQDPLNIISQLAISFRRGLLSLQELRGCHDCLIVLPGHMVLRLSCGIISWAIRHLKISNLLELDTLT